MHYLQLGIDGESWTVHPIEDCSVVETDTDAPTGGFSFTINSPVWCVKWVLIDGHLMDYFCKDSHAARMFPAGTVTVAINNGRVLASLYI